MANYLQPIQIIKTFNSYDYIGTTIIPIKWVPPNTIPIIPTVPVAAAKTASISAPIASAPIASAPVTSAPVTSAPVVSAPTINKPIIDENMYVIYTVSSNINQVIISITNTQSALSSIQFTNISSILSIEYNGIQITAISDNFFTPFTNLKALIGFSSIKTIGNASFNECSNLITIPTFISVVSLGNNAFYNCQKLQLSDNSFMVLTSLGGSAFFNCNQITKISGFQLLTEISSNAFMFCSSAKLISGFEKVNKINSQAFTYCSGITKPAFLTNISNSNIDPNAFIGCSFTTI